MLRGTVVFVITLHGIEVLLLLETTLAILLFLALISLQARSIRLEI